MILKRSCLKKILKYLLVFIIISIFLFLYYLYKLRSLAIEWNKIFGWRCRNVNPLLISYKNYFLKYAQYINKLIEKEYLSDEEIKEAVKYFKLYLETMKKYTEAEKNWLSIQKKFMERWDFKLFAPWYIKKGSLYQYQMYQGYLEDAVYILNIQKNKKEFKTVNKEESEARKKRNQAINQYNQFLNNLKKIKDWRRYLMNVPLDESCTEENLVIPNTEGVIEWNKNPSPIPPTTILIDPEKSS